MVHREEESAQAVRFEPLRPASRRRMIAAMIVGPLLWLLALFVAALAFNRSGAIAIGVLATVASFVVSLLVLALLRAARNRQEERYAERR